MILRKSYGGAYIVMDSKKMGNDLCLAWPWAELAVMGAGQAAAILQRRATPEERAAFEADYAERLLNPYVAAERGYVDAVIDPADTRREIAAALEMLENKRELLPPPQARQRAALSWPDAGSLWADPQSVVRRIREAGTIRPRADAWPGAVVHDGCMTFTTFAPSQSLIAREILRKVPGRSLAQDHSHVVRVARRPRRDTTQSRPRQSRPRQSRQGQQVSQWTVSLYQAARFTIYTCQCHALPASPPVPGSPCARSSSSPPPSSDTSRSAT